MNQINWKIIHDENDDYCGDDLNKTIVISTHKNYFNIAENFECKEQKYIILHIEESVYNAIIKMMSYSAKCSFQFSKQVDQYETEVREYCEKYKWLHSSITSGTTTLKMMLFKKQGTNRHFDLTKKSILGFQIDFTTKHSGGAFLNLVTVLEDTESYPCKDCTKDAKKKHFSGCLECQYFKMYDYYKGPCKILKNLVVKCTNKNAYCFGTRLYKNLAGKRLLDLL